MDDNTENVREDDSYILDGINNNTYILFLGTTKIYQENVGETFKNIWLGVQ